jgi:hypothetical protein
LSRSRGDTQRRPRKRSPRLKVDIPRPGKVCSEVPKPSVVKAQDAVG